jgi:hypothetical protein
MAKFNTGQSFADGDTVTGAKLNNITSLLNIYTGVISEQAAMSATVSTADQLLIADTDNGDSGAANKITVQKLFDDSLTNGTYTAANLSGTITANRTVATSATITTGTIPTLVSNNATIGTTNGTLGNFTSAAITSGTITTALIPTLTAGTTTGTAGIFTSGTIATLNSTTGTIATLNSTTGTIGNLSTTLAGDFTISQGTATLATSGATAGTYGSVTAIPFITIDAKGRITSATTGTFSSTPADGSITFAKLSTSTTEADNAAKRVAKAWVQFDGLTNVGGFCTIKDDFNVSTVADNGTGNYTINFSTAIGNVNYAIAGMAQPTSAVPNGIGISPATSPTSAALTVVTWSGTGPSISDAERVTVVVFAS